MSERSLPQIEELEALVQREIDNYKVRKRQEEIESFQKYGCPDPECKEVDEHLKHYFRYYNSVEALNSAVFKLWELSEQGASDTLSKYKDGLTELAERCWRIHHFYPDRMNEQGVWYAAIDNDCDKPEYVVLEGTYLDAMLAAAKICIYDFAPGHTLLNNLPPHDLVYFVDYIAKEQPKQISDFELKKIEKIKKNVKIIVDKDPYLTILRHLFQKYVFDDGAARMMRPR